MLTKPPFCPNRDCSYHFEEDLPKEKRNSWYHKDGSYTTQVGGTILRFVCTKCGKRFSSQTFSLDYGVKHHIPYHRIFDHITTCSGIRALARLLKVSEGVVINRISRLARQAIALHALLRETFFLQEEIVADGFESFTCSQYHPNNIHLAVGKDSQYLFGADYSHLRRKGRMTEEQLKRREELEQEWRSPKGDIVRSFLRLLRQIDEYRGEENDNPVRLYTDEKQEYRRCTEGESWFDHLQVPSTDPRTLRNELFAVNYYDREIRKDQSNHTRETVEYSRDVNNAMDRMWIYSVYHNYVKPYRIDRSEERTHGECAGIDVGKLKRLWKRFFTQRFFVSRVRLSESEWYSWYRCYATPMKLTATVFPQYADA
jgi:transposase-like protein